MIFLGGTFGYAVYVVLIIGRYFRREKHVTARFRLLLNILAPGMGYYYNNEIKRAACFFLLASVFVLFLLSGGSVWLVLTSMWLLVAIFEWQSWHEQSLMQQMKRLEACTNKRPIVALDEYAMNHPVRRQQLWKLYEQSTYEFAITKAVINQLQQPHLKKQLELMFYEGRLRIVDYNIQPVMAHFSFNPTISEEMAHFIADSVEQKEVFVMPFTMNTPQFPGIIHFKK